MKHLKKISVLAAVLVMVSMILASCGGGGLKGDPAVGTWEMTEVEYAGQTLSADDLKSTGQMDEMPKLNDQTFDEATATAMKPQLEQAMNSMESQFQGMIDDLKEDSGIDDVSMTIVYQDANGTELYSNTYQ